MKRWIDLYGTYGTYESGIKTVSSDFDYFIPTISTNYSKNDGAVSLFIRASKDNGVNWSDWVEILDNEIQGTLFDGDGFALNNILYQYRVFLDISNDVTGVSPEFDKFSMDLTGAYKIVNLGDVVCKPEIWIKKINGSGDIKLINERNNMSLELKDLNNGETVYIDCENEDIVSDIPLVFRYKDHNNTFLELEVGENLLSGEGDFKLSMKMEFKLLQG